MRMYSFLNIFLSALADGVHSSKGSTPCRMVMHVGHPASAESTKSAHGRIRNIGSLFECVSGSTDASLHEAGSQSLCSGWQTQGFLDILAGQGMREMSLRKLRKLCRLRREKRHVEVFPSRGDEMCLRLQLVNWHLGRKSKQVTCRFPLLGTDNTKEQEKDTSDFTFYLIYGSNLSDFSYLNRQIHLR